jgi:hypothetical protein
LCGIFGRFLFRPSNNLREVQNLAAAQKQKVFGGQTNVTPPLIEQLGVLFDSSCATAAQAATVEHESDRP